MCAGQGDAESCVKARVGDQIVFAAELDCVEITAFDKFYLCHNYSDMEHMVGLRSLSHEEISGLDVRRCKG